MTLKKLFGSWMRMNTFSNHSGKLRDAKSSALYHAGRYAEAKAANERSKRKGLTPDNLRVDLGIAIAAGDWGGNWRDTE